MSATTEEKTNRYGMWFCLAAFSVIALVSFTSNIPNSENLGDQPQEFKWGTSVAIISLILSSLSVFAHALIREKFVGTMLEGGLSVIVLAMWCAGLPAIMDPSNGLAQVASGVVANANMYFFTWASFLMSLLIFAGYMKEGHNVGTAGTRAEFMYQMWLVLFAGSVVVMAASVRSYKSVDCDQSPMDGTDFCHKLEFGVGLGVVSAVLALLSILLAKMVPGACDAILSIILLVAWCCGITFITFGNGPARGLGNLYFSTWTSFVASASLGGNGVKHLWNTFFGHKEEETTAPVQEEKKEMKDEEADQPEVIEPQA